MWGGPRYKLFNLARGFNKNLTPGDVSGMASCVLLAALAIPPYTRAAAAATDAQAEVERDRAARMAAILGFPPVCAQELVNWFDVMLGPVANA